MFRATILNPWTREKNCMNTKGTYSLLFALGTGLIWWGLPILWPNAPPVVGAFAILFAIVLLATAALQFARQSQWVDWPLIPMITLLALGLTVGFLFVPVRTKPISQPEIIENFSNLNSSKSAYSNGEGISSSNRGGISNKNNVSNTREKFLDDPSIVRPAPLKDGRFSLAGKIAKPFSLSQPRIILTNRTGREIHIKSLDWSARTDQFEIVRERMNNESIMAPYSTRQIFGNNEIDVGFLKDEKVELAISMELEYTVSREAEYGNTLSELHYCQLSSPNDDSPNCELLSHSDRVPR